MKLIGLEKVKERFVEQFQRVQIAKEQGTEAGKSYNARFTGNPGTGKTTVAKLYANMLVELGVLPEDSIVKETSGSTLLAKGVNELTAILDEVKDAEGGVIFIDEAYQLNPAINQAGATLLDLVLTQSEQFEGQYG